MPEQILHPTGAKRDPKDPRDIMFASLVPAAVQVDLPRKYSLRDQLWFKRYLQQYGSCVGGLGRYGSQYYLDKWKGEKKILSDRFYYGQAKQLDGYPNEQGTWPRVMLKVMFGIGSPLYERWPQDPNSGHADFIKQPPDDVREEAIENVLTGGFVRVMNYEELKKAIYLYGIVGVCLNVLDTYDNVDSTGHIKPSSNLGSMRGSHQNVAIGWNDDTQEIELMNQWGENWGDKGFAFMPINYNPGMNFPLFDMWAITSQVNAAVSAGAPISLGYPVETSTPFVTQKFGERPEYYKKYGMNGHNGIDFRTKDLKNKFIVAADDGEVVLAGPNGSYGLCVRLKHSWGMSLYAHNSKLLVSDNFDTPQKVKRGDRIAVPGDSGDTGTPPAEHCHFGIRINGVKNPGFFDWLDASPYFKEQSMTKFFRVQQGGTSGVMVLEGFGGSIIMEDQWGDYQDLLKTMGMTLQSPVINLPAGSKFRIDDHGKAGIILLSGGYGAIVFENDWTEYQVLLKTQNMTLSDPLVTAPN